MYKVGDKLLCKKDLYFSIGSPQLLKQDKKYEILSIFYDSVKIKIYVKKHKNIDYWYFGTQIKKEFIPTDVNLQSYFYTKEEERKLKLEKLQCIK